MKFLSDLFFTDIDFCKPKVIQGLDLNFIFWHHGVVVMNIAQLPSTKSELRFCAGSNPACDVSEIHDGEDL